MKYLLLNLAVFLILGVIATGVIFGLAGRWDLWNIWAYAWILVVLLIIVTLVDYRKSPDLLRERFQPTTAGRVRWTTSRAFFALSIVQWIITGLDQRFHWSTVFPPSAVVAGLVIFAFGWGLAAWAGSVNPFFSPAVRIQKERGQRVISEGPYAMIRHPGYFGFLLVSVASPPALNSLLAIVPTVILVANIISVTRIEDEMLREDLAGYGDYAAKVRYRLIPGVW